jgi:hypothetical protein
MDSNMILIVGAVAVIYFLVKSKEDKPPTDAWDLTDKSKIDIPGTPRTQQLRLRRELDAYYATLGPKTELDIAAEGRIASALASYTPPPLEQQIALAATANQRIAEAAAKAQATAPTLDLSKSGIQSASSLFSRYR